jgi:hypothetical protein
MIQFKTCEMSICEKHNGNFYKDQKGEIDDGKEDDWGKD